MDKTIIYLKNISETTDKWLESDISNLTPEMISLIQQLHDLSILENYNARLRDKYGKDITVQLKSRIDEDGSEKFYYTSAKYGNSKDYNTVYTAFIKADRYLQGIGELW